MKLMAVVTVLAVVLGAAGAAGQKPVLGPKDGHGLPPTDLERVKVGDVAPDFTLEAFRGPPVTLSRFRGKKNVILVFYRGHW
jgi:cytochrome oxidase Cu insertion factor (SCO1/SenC/PrrC family)